MDVLTRTEMKVDAEEDVVVVRRAVRAIAQARGFDTFACAAITTATSELVRNIWVHAKKGKAILEELNDGSRVGIRMTFVDEGPGIPDIPRVLAGGYSTAKSMGLGLSGSRRLVDEFTLESEVGRGTSITFVKWKPY